MASSTAESKTRRAIALNATWLSLAVAGLWMFPSFWYTRTDPGRGYFWLAEQSGIRGWQFTEEPISQAAEAVLAADKVVNGEFAGDGSRLVRVFSARRYLPNEGEFDMFAHTPDRCWTSVGWEVESAAPECVDVDLHGLAMRLERRVFRKGAHRELVYFGALVGGQPLPYRLDQHQNIAARRTAKAPTGIFGKMIGAIDARYFAWPLKSFVNRRPLGGPKQFIRVSTPIVGNSSDSADSLLQEILPQWLVLADYH
jgi:hypothetical protein